jgi:hypothetical protein
MESRIHKDPAVPDNRGKPVIHYMPEKIGQFPSNNNRTWILVVESLLIPSLEHIQSEQVFNQFMNIRKLPMPGKRSMHFLACGPPNIYVTTHVLLIRYSGFQEQ